MLSTLWCPIPPHIFHSFCRVIVQVNTQPTEDDFSPLRLVHKTPYSPIFDLKFGLKTPLTATWLVKTFTSYEIGHVQLCSDKAIPSLCPDEYEVDCEWEKSVADTMPSTALGRDYVINYSHISGKFRTRTTKKGWYVPDAFKYMTHCPNAPKISWAKIRK